ncbi:MAG TPA: hypothetical protein VGS27_02120 [Candidatus Sulfotelmatobacter sp.]|nr:hypothetical protein [Candidatus Sulfotelmatobacter sp.]
MGNGKFLKQPEQQARKREPKKSQPIETEPSAIEYLDINGLDYIAESMDAIRRVLIGHFNNAYQGENKLAIFTGPSGSGYHPVLIALEPSETMESIISAFERIATAFERIADATAGQRGAASTGGVSKLGS